ncbi:MAG: O-antigen ligase family protein [Exilispira sp.]
MNSDKQINIITIIFFLFFASFSILNLFSFISINNVRIINTTLILLYILAIIVLSKDVFIINLIYYLTGLLSIVYFVEILFLSNLFDYLIIADIILLSFVIIKNKINIKNIYIKNSKNNFPLKLFAIFLILWFIYSLSALLWAKEKYIVIHRLQFILYANLIFFLYLYLYDSNKFEIVVNFLFIISIFFIITSFIELKFHFHFKGSHPLRLGEYSNLIGGTTYNINDFATFLYLFSFFIISYFCKRFKKWYLSFIIFIIITPLFIFFIKNTESLANLYGYYIFSSFSIIIFILFIFNLIFKILLNKKHIVLLILFFCIIALLAGLLLIYFSNNKIELILKKINQIISIINIALDPKTKYLYSDTIRIRLIINSLIMLKDSFFMGVGPGNSIKLMAEYSKKYYNVENIRSLHNFWLELLVEYGLIIFLIFIIFYLSLLFRFLKITYSINSTLMDSILAIFSFSSLAGFFIASVSVSSLLTRQLVWIYLSYLIIISQYNKSEDLNYKTAEFKIKYM